ncbi:Rgp1-domain-containing protein [Backusella circina FSU 941]|nr:Rgp1-domain-containing protein [Backusella circina FSU 941]
MATKTIKALKRAEKESLLLVCKINENFTSKVCWLCHHQSKEYKKVIYSFSGREVSLRGALQLTTTFSQGAVFYAGETLTCTIAFTNPLPSLTKPVRNSYSTPQLYAAARQARLAPSTHARSSSTPRSITSLASSTLAYLMGSSHQQQQALPKEEADDIEQKIEVESHDTPRSSIDTVFTPRSSIDSIASVQSRRFNIRPTSRNQQLMFGSAQIIGNFVTDPNLINASEFEELRQNSAFNPLGTPDIAETLFFFFFNKCVSFLDGRTFPIFSTPPSILFVDLNIAPGETKKFSYKITLPNDLPPSHRGKTIRFNYYLVIAVQKPPSVQAGKPTLPPQSQLVHIRFRVLNHVSENGSRPVYDLMNPIVLYKDTAIVDEKTIAIQKPHKKKILNLSDQLEERKAFMDYIDELLENTTNTSIHEITRRESDAYEEQNIDEPIEGYNKSCSQIVSRITHSSRKAMYDICKNNQRVAKLHLVKTAHRLGEPIMGVIDFSEAILTTFRVSIFLESIESVEESIAQRPKHHIARVSRKSHSDFHSFCLNNKCISFSLPIPAAVSPEFQTTGVTLKYFLKVEFITGASVPFIPINIDEKHRHYQCLQDVEVSTFDCQIPVTVYGSPSALYGRPHMDFLL